jgi:hypothetical protein
MEHLGTPKAIAAASIIREINPDVNLSYWDRHVDHGAIPAIVETARRTDLLALFADDFGIMGQVAEQCSGICPQVVATFGPNADYAEVAFSVPGLTPPVARTIGSRRREPIGSPSAFGCDTAFVASFVAALCLELLLSEQDRSRLVQCYANAPLFLLGLRKAWVFQNEPAEIARVITCVHTGQQ